MNKRIEMPNGLIASIDFNSIPSYLLLVLEPNILAVGESLEQGVLAFLRRG